MRRAPNWPRTLSLLVLAASLLAAWPARAQGSPPAAGAVVISAVDASAFPAMQAYAQVNNAAGQHIAGLPAAGFKLSEDGGPVGALQAAEADLGVQIVFAIDSSAAFKTRDANGVTRLDYIKQSLADFAQTKPYMRTGLDDATVLASEGPLLEHSSDGASVANAVSGYQSNFTGVADPFTLVNQALDFASDATPRPGMRRFIVLISGGFAKPDVQGPVADAASRANGVGVPIYTVYVGPLGAGNTQPAQNLKKLADATGGQALILETPQSLAPAFQMLADQGRQYRLSYRSSLSTTGQNKLAVTTTLSDGTVLTSTDTLFPLRLEPPQVVLGSMPQGLVRVAPSATAALPAAQPSAYAVPLTVDFPDGHARVLKLVQLVVDGQVVASEANTTTITSLNWSLASYATNAPHQLQARVVDELGLAAESQVSTVSVSLQVPAAPVALPAPVAAVANGNWPLLALAAGGLLAALLVGAGAWFVLARRQPVPEPVSTRPRARVAVKAAPAINPAADLPEGATIPMLPANGHAPADPQARRLGRRSLPHVALPAWRWPGRHAHGPFAPAFLQVVEPGGGGAPVPNIELLAASLSLGRDGAVAETVFHDRSVSRLHARIVAEAGQYHIFDEGSTSGTWVNFTPVPPEAGQLLQDGDLINLGRVQLRFQCRDHAGANGHGTQVSVLPANGAPLTVGAPTAMAPAAVEPAIAETPREPGA